MIFYRSVLISKNYVAQLGLFTLLIVLSSQFSFGNFSTDLNHRGWTELARDNDTLAVQLFSEALEQAKVTHDTLNSATALLNLGIASYSVSLTDGMNYALRSIEEYSKFEAINRDLFLEGRSKCLQLISTIKSRQGKYRESIDLSVEALKGFSIENDSSDYPGLIYNSIGYDYDRLGLIDSADIYYYKALQARVRAKNVTYLPGAYISVANIELRKGNKKLSGEYYDKAYSIAVSSENRQSTVASLLGKSKWILKFENDQKSAELVILKAKSISLELTDRTFYLSCLDQLINLKKLQYDYQSIAAFQEEKNIISDTLFTYEKQRLQKSLELQFEISEKDRQVKLAEREKDVVKLTNYLLWAVIVFVLIISLSIIYFIRRNHKRDKQLLLTKEQLMIALTEQKKLKEQQMQNEIEFKESQLTAMALQMVQKNELLQELKEKLDEDKSISKDSPINKIIHKDQNQDKEWIDFNTHFESLNKNFYSRLKVAYPEISPNDLKICALIKLNLSIKEMAAILNISPDSVKTARYRLRKKLQLNTEDNLTDFILNLQ